MTSEAGFYKANDSKDSVFYAPNAVYSANYTLVSTDKDTYEYPIDGWTWYETKSLAIAAEGVTEPDTPQVDERGRPIPRQRRDRNAIVQE